MNLKSGILVVTKEPATADAVVSALEGSDRLEPAGVLRGLQDLVARLESRPAPAVLVDIDPQPGHMLKRLDKVITRFDHTRFLVLSRDVRNDLVLEAMQAGARYFLQKQSIPSDLADVLQRLVRNGAESEGVLITVLSVGGGSGATTLAVNLGNEIKLATSRSTVIVDLDSSYGTVSSYLGLTGRYSIADVLSDHAAIDSDLIRTTAVAHSDRLDVLLSPASIDYVRPAPVDHTLLKHALSACKSTYDYTVVDAPRIPIDLAVSLANASRFTLLVFQLTVKDIHILRATVDALLEGGVAQDGVVALANRYRKRGQMITLEEARRILGHTRIGTISNDYRSAILGSNYGKPLSQVAPRSVLRRDIESLAVRICRARRTRPMNGRIPSER